MNGRIRVLIADDERPARSFLASILRSFEDVDLIWRGDQWDRSARDD